MCLLFLLGLNSHSLLLFKFRHGLERQEPRHQDEPKGACPTVATQESPNLKESEQVLYAKRRPYFEPTEASDMVVCFPAVLHCNSRQISRQASEEEEMNSNHHNQKDQKKHLDTPIFRSVPVHPMAPFLVSCGRLVLRSDSLSQMLHEVVVSLFCLTGVPKGSSLQASQVMQASPSSPKSVTATQLVPTT